MGKNESNFDSMTESNEMHVEVTQTDEEAAHRFAKEWPGLDLPHRTTAFQFARHRAATTAEHEALKEAFDQLIRKVSNVVAVWDREDDPAKWLHYRGDLRLAVIDAQIARQEALPGTDKGEG